MKKLFFNKALRILLITNGFIMLAGAMLAPIYALFVSDIGGSLLDASLTQGVFAITAGIATIYAARYADYSGKESKIITGSYLVMGIGFFMFTIVDSIWTLLLVQALIGFAEAIYLPSFDSLYCKHLRKGKFAREWGAYEACQYFSVAIGAIVGGFIATYFGFHILFICMGILSISSAMFVYMSPKCAL